MRRKTKPCKSDIEAQRFIDKFKKRDNVIVISHLIGKNHEAVIIYDKTMTDLQARVKRAKERE